MPTIKLMVVEDDKQEVDGLQDTAEGMAEGDTGNSFKLVPCSNLDTARDQIDSTFDGVIVDLLLADDQDGNVLVDELRKDFRFPIAIYSGTPPDIDDKAISVCV